MIHLIRCAAVIVLFGAALSQAAEQHRLLFFSKSSGFEHPVISWKKGQPSYAENVLSALGKKHGWEFEFSKDGSKFSKDYLAQFDALIFYTSGDLTTAGNDKQPPMSAAGKTALMDYIKHGGGFVGLHSSTDTFKTPSKDRLAKNESCDPYICMIGGEFITHGKQQEATNRVINPAFPGYENAGISFTLFEEWYALKNLNPDIHALTVIDPSGMQGKMYERPPYPTSWARTEGKGRVYYNAMGHREDIWTHSLFNEMLVGAVRWATGEVDVATPPNLKDAAPGAHANHLK